MRHFINIVESLIPEVDRNAIVQHMIDAVTTNSYWDDDAKTADGSPMDTGDSYDMAQTWGHKVGSGRFNKRVAVWANARYDEVIEKIEASLTIEQGKCAIHRLIRASEIRTSGLGIYWTFDHENADIDSAPWGSATMPEHLWLHGRVAQRDVDWHYTILANMDWMSGDREHELRVNKGAPIDLIEYWPFDENTGEHGDPVPVGKTYPA